MITKCPHCSALLDCPQDVGSIVDCAGCGKSFYALPCDEGEELEKAREADPLKAREKELIEIREARRQREVREAELEESRRQQERAELLKQQMKLSHHVKEIQGDALALAAIGRGSGWAGCMIFLGIISIIIGVIALVILLDENSDQAFLVFAISIGAGITCLFNAFLLDVFTDIRWLLSLLAKPNYTNNEGDKG